MNFNVETNRKHSWETSSTVDDLIGLTVYLKKYKWIYLGVCALLFTVCFYIYHSQTYYTSHISFLVNSSNMAEVLWDRTADVPFDVGTDDRGYNRINQIVYSSQMMDYLIQRFDLYKHYRIDTSETDAYLYAVTILKSHMKVKISNTRIITVEISDKLDFGVAADMANAIGKKINDINRQITIDNLVRKTEMFEALSKDLRASSQREFNQMDSLFKNMQRFLSNSVHDEGYRHMLTMNIENLQSKSENYFHDLFESYKYRLYSMYSLQEKNLPTISVLEKALPNRNSKYRYNIYVYPLLVFFSLLIPLVGAYLTMKASPLVSYIFAKSKERK